MNKLKPKAFFALQETQPPYALWRKVVKTLETWLPEAGPARTTFLQDWDHEIGHHFEDRHRLAARAWWSKFEFIEPRDRWEAESGGTHIFKGYRQPAHPLWPLARHLSLHFDQGFHADHFAALKTLPLDHITGLSTNTAASPHDWAQVLEGRGAPPLDDLSVSWGSLDEEFLQRAADFALWQRLKSLTLKWSGITDHELPMLLNLLDGGNLRRLHLYKQPLGEQSGRILGRWPQLRRLAYLGLDDVGLCDKTIRDLIMGPGPYALEELFIKDGGSQTPEMGLRTGEAFGESNVLEGLKTLRIESSSLRCAGVSALVKNPRLKDLETLMIRLSGLGDEGAIAIAEATHMAALKRLDIDYNAGVTTRGIEALRAAPHLKNVSLRLP